MLDTKRRFNHPLKRLYRYRTLLFVLHASVCKVFSQ